MPTQDTTTCQQPAYYTADPAMVLMEMVQELRRLNANIEKLTYQSCPTDQSRVAIHLDLSADAVEKLGHLLRRT